MGKWLKYVRPDSHLCCSDVCLEEPDGLSWRYVVFPQTKLRAELSCLILKL